MALNELVHAYADLYVASKKRNRATAKLVGDIFDPVSAFPLCTGVRVTKWLKRLVDAYSNAETTLDEFQLVALDERIKQDLRYIDYLHHWIDRYDLRAGRFTDSQNPNNLGSRAVHSYFEQMRRDVKAEAKGCGGLQAGLGQPEAVREGARRSGNGHSNRAGALRQHRQRRVARALAPGRHDGHAHGDPGSRNDLRRLARRTLPDGPTRTTRCPAYTCNVKARGRARSRPPTRPFPGRGRAVRDRRGRILLRSQ
ncbi:MAG: hypothetical protein M5T61_20905 [Acidimicrobiia bacterium]|nr:hypothetical protein [Acidimicrobiia bacterium]